MAMRGRVVALLVGVGMLLAFVAPAFAAQPASGKVGPSAPSATWTGMHFVVAQTPDPSACGSPQAPNPLLCDHYGLTVDTDSDYWADKTGGVLVTISWDDKGDDFDLYAYNDADGDPNTAEAVACDQCSSAQQGTTSEQIFIPAAAGAYDIVVVATNVTDSDYAGSVDFLEQAPSSDTSGDETVGATQSFTPGTDHANWYWREQEEHQVLIGPVGTNVRYPSPQAPDTLPVSVVGGDGDKMASLAIDLTARGVVPGSTITKFVLHIAEGTGENLVDSQPKDQPEYNTTDQDGKPREVDACVITDAWAEVDGGADLWKQYPDGPRPRYDNTQCVAGTRDDSDPAKPMWTFDLTTLAAPWGENPFLNYGVMLIPVVDPDAGPHGQTWQINFKLPVRDQTGTPNDEGTETQYKTTFDLDFDTGDTSTPAPPPPTTPPPPITQPPTTSFGPPPSSTTTTDFSTPPPVPEPSPSSQTPVAERPPVATVPHIPWYAWVLMPFGLVALASVRSAVFDTAGGTRPGGVIASIRARNAAARGASVSAPSAPAPSPEPPAPADPVAAIRDRARSLFRRPKE